MKKVLSIILIVLCLFSLCSCAQNPYLIKLENLLGFTGSTDWESFSTKESSFGSAYKNHFAKLNTDQKKAYNNILETFYGEKASFPDKIEIPVMNGDSLTTLFEALVYDNPELFFLDKSCSLLTEGDLCYFKPDYIMTRSDYNALLEKLNQKVKSILAPIPENSSDFEKELYVHDYIAKSCDYDAENQYSGSIFGCLLNNVAACEGYSKATKYLLEAVGIENYTVIGMARNSLGEEESHMWNVVNINGDYYYLDVTWDDPKGNESDVSHTYMNLNSSEIKIDHYDFAEDFECSQTEENYFVKSGSMFFSYNNSDYNEIKSLLGSNAQKGINRIEMRFSNKSAYDKAIYQLTKKGKAYNLVTEVNKKYSVNLNTNHASYTVDDRFFVIELIF